ncbi:hypothetical protein FACS189497_14570 [Betaproteobacteria bacterium]|nr:hypothetical protein FACS189497_14570 [Betaproteobacteria bacterium]
MKVHLDEAKRQGTSLDTLKSELQALDPELYNQLGLDFLNSSDELTNRLTSHETELTNRKAELQAQADKARNQLIYNQKTKAEQKDIHKKETLNFIHQIRFDSLPQATTDTIIANINQAPNNY